MYMRVQVSARVRAYIYILYYIYTVYTYRLPTPLCTGRYDYYSCVIMLFCSHMLIAPDDLCQHQSWHAPQ